MLIRNTSSEVVITNLFSFLYQLINFISIHHLFPKCLQIHWHWSKVIILPMLILKKTLNPSHIYRFLWSQVWIWPLDLLWSQVWISPVKLLWSQVTISPKKLLWYQVRVFTYITPLISGVNFNFINIWCKFWICEFYSIKHSGDI